MSKTKPTGKQKPVQQQKKKQPAQPTQKVVYVRRSFLWNILAILLAFLLGVGAAIGGIVIAANKLSLKKILGATGVAYDKILTEEAANQSLVSLVGDMLTNDWSSLNGLAKYSPLVKDKLVAANGEGGMFYNLGVTVDVDEFMAKPFGELSSYIQDDVVQEIKLGKLLSVNADSDPMTIELCYGTPEHYTVNEQTREIIPNPKKESVSSIVSEKAPIEYPVTVHTFQTRAGDLIDNLYVETAFGTGADSTPMMRYLAYGTEGVDYDVVDNTIVMRAGAEKRKLSSVTADDSTLVDDMTVGNMTNTENASPFMQSIRDWTVAELKQKYRIERLRIGDVMEVNTEDSKLMQAIQGWRICDLSEQKKIDTLELNKVINVTDESPEILKAIANTTLGGLNKKVDSLLLCEVMDETSIDNNKVLKHLKYARVNNLAAEIDALEIGIVFRDDIYSYTTTEHYNQTLGNSVESERKPVHADKKIDGANVRHHYWANGREVISGFFYEDEGKYYFSEKPYYHKRISVSPVYSYEQYNCDTGEKSPLPEGAQDVIDEFPAGNVPDRITVNGVKIDLEQSVTYVYENGDLVNESLTEVRKDDDGYYVDKEYTAIEYYYPIAQDTTKSFALSDLALTAEDRCETTDETPVPVTKYFDGIWWMTLEYGESGEDDPVHKPITEMADLFSGSTGKLNQITMRHFWLHGIVSVEPKAEITLASGEKKPLGDMTVSDVITYMNGLDTPAT